MKKLNILCPSGFPEFTPAQERVRQKWIKIISDVFEQNGFMRVDTPLVEREENLLAKGGNPKEMYVLKRLHDEPGDDTHSGMALRFDHTVPLALYVARHFSELTFPFRRYVMGPSFRGERAQKGRYRQFDQCDIDVIGVEKLSFLNDAQMPSIIIQVFEKLNIGDFMVRINNRKILLGFFESVGVSKAQLKDTLDIVDDLEKIGEEAILKKLKETGIQEGSAQAILSFAKISGDPEEILSDLSEIEGNETFCTGVTELRTVIEGVEAMKVPTNRYQIDLSIARGLDYYTGTVFETRLVGQEGIGSICSGGRYDDLAEVFTGKKLPGVGISIGLTRLLPQLFEAGIIDTERASPSDVLVIAMSEVELWKALEIGTRLREVGIRAENYLEPKKVGKQFDYANKLGIPYCIVIGEDEIAQKIVQIKNMKQGTQEIVKDSELETYMGNRIKHS